MIDKNPIDFLIQQDDFESKENFSTNCTILDSTRAKNEEYIEK